MPTGLKPLAATLATNHRGKLKRTLDFFAHRFLEAHAQSKAHPHSRTMAKRV